MVWEHHLWNEHCCLNLIDFCCPELLQSFKIHREGTAPCPLSFPGRQPSSTWQLNVSSDASKKKKQKHLKNPLAPGLLNRFCQAFIYLRNSHYFHGQMDNVSTDRCEAFGFSRPLLAYTDRSLLSTSRRPRNRCECFWMHIFHWEKINKGQVVVLGFLQQQKVP